MLLPQIIPVELLAAEPFLITEPESAPESDKGSGVDEAPEDKITFEKALDGIPAHASFRYLQGMVAAEVGPEILEKREFKNLLFAMKPKSKWYDENLVGQEELYEACEKLLNDLKLYEDSEVFWHRVKTRDAPDYYQVIKRPMDYTTMRKKLATHIYKNKQEFMDDLNLIYDNCLNYNTHPDSPYRRAANNMRVRTNRLSAHVPDISIRLRQEVEEEERQRVEAERKRKREVEKFQAAKRRKMKQFKKFGETVFDKVPRDLEYDTGRLELFQMPPTPSSPKRSIWSHGNSLGLTNGAVYEPGNSSDDDSTGTPCQRNEMDLQPKGDLVGVIRDNIEILEMIREEHHRISMLKEHGVLNFAKAPFALRPKNFAYVPANSHHLASDQALPARLSRNVCMGVMQKVITEMLAHSGFEGVSTVALEVLTDAFVQCMGKLGTSARNFEDRFCKTYDAHDIIMLVLREHGFTLQSLDSHLNHDVFKFSHKIVELRKKLAAKLHELLVTETEDEGVDFDEDSEDLFVSGSLFDEVLNEDFFGIGDVTRTKNIPVDLWYKNRKRPRILKRLMRKDLPLTTSARVLKYPIPPPFEPPDLNKVIGLVRPFLEIKFANKETVEDEFMSTKQKQSRQRARTKGISPWMRKNLPKESKGKTGPAQDASMDVDTESPAASGAATPQMGVFPPPVPAHLNLASQDHQATDGESEVHIDLSTAEGVPAAPTANKRRYKKEPKVPGAEREKKPRKPRKDKDDKGCVGRKPRKKKGEPVVPQPGMDAELYNHGFSNSQPIFGSADSLQMVPQTAPQSTLSNYPPSGVPSMASTPPPSATSGSLKDVLSGKIKLNASSQDPSTSMASRVREQLAQKSLAKLRGSSGSSPTTPMSLSQPVEASASVKDVLKRDASRPSSVSGVRVASLGRSPSLEQLLQSGSGGSKERPASNSSASSIASHVIGGNSSQLTSLVMSSSQSTSTHGGGNSQGQPSTGAFGTAPTSDVPPSVTKASSLKSLFESRSVSAANTAPNSQANSAATSRSGSISEGSSVSQEQAQLSLTPAAPVIAQSMSQPNPSSQPPPPQKSLPKPLPAPVVPLTASRSPVGSVSTPPSTLSGPTSQFFSKPPPTSLSNHGSPGFVAPVPPPSDSGSSSPSSSSSSSSSNDESSDIEQEDFIATQLPIVDEFDDSRVKSSQSPAMSQVAQSSVGDKTNDSDLPFDGHEADIEDV